MNTTTISEDKKNAYRKEALEKWIDGGMDSDFWHTTDDGLYDINVFEMEQTGEDEVVSFDSLSKPFISWSLYDLAIPEFERVFIPMGSIVWSDL